MPPFDRQAEKPLFQDIFWNRPAMRSRGGRLAIIGGHKNEFSELQAIFETAEAAGIGEATAVMPNSLRRTVGGAGFRQFVPAAPSGSIGKAALGELLHITSESDASVIGANLTNNAETAVVIESLVTRADDRVVITEDAIEILKFNPALITGNPNALIVTTMSGLFALANHHQMPIAIRPGGGVVGYMAILQQLVDVSRSSYMIFDQEIFVAAEGKISLTPLPQSLTKFPAAVVGTAATFWVQHPTRPYAALTTAAFTLAKASEGEQPATYSTLASAIRKTIADFDQ